MGLALELRQSCDLIDLDPRFVLKRVGDLQHPSQRMPCEDPDA
jgi:hypothetical protein